MTVLEAAGLSVSLNGGEVIRGVGFALSSGTLVGLAGPNGVGKSTLIRALAGLLPYRGSIRLNGLELSQISPDRLAKTRSYLPQGGAVHWPMQVRSVVALGRFPSADAETPAGRAAIDRAMAAANVSQFAGRTFDALSGGERARVLLARALAAEVPVLFADEPSAQLDARHAYEALEIVKSRTAQGSLAVVAMHDLTAIARFCDQMILLAADGSIALGPPSEILTAARIRAVFGVDAHIGQAQGAPYVVPLRAAAAV